MKLGRTASDNNFISIRRKRIKNNNGIYYTRTVIIIFVNLVHYFQGWKGLIAHQQDDRLFLFEEAGGYALVKERQSIHISIQRDNELKDGNYMFEARTQDEEGNSVLVFRRIVYIGKE